MEPRIERKAQLQQLVTFCDSLCKESVALNAYPQSDEVMYWKSLGGGRDHEWKKAYQKAQEANLSKNETEPED